MEDKSYYGHGFIEKLKKANDIVSVLSKYIRLEKKGKNYWACCPFHQEKAPSFCIDAYEQFYHCFGCGESGDVITFLQKFEKLEFSEAIKILADNAGMKIPKFENDEKYIKTKKLKDKYLEILNLTKEFYKTNIYKPDAKLAQEYIKRRKVGKTELEDFELGYSPNPYELVKLLKAKGFTDNELKEAGVCEISKNGKTYDFLTGRLIFPIINSQNNCIGFSGRDLKNSDMMKYKNTSATLLFDKSKAVYAINLVKKFKQSSINGDNIILVEGQFDVIAMHRAGFKNTVACLGTAITKEHIRELRRFANTIVLCLDGDDAGQKATIRAIENLTGSGLFLKAVRLPKKHDPDEFIKLYGSEKLQELIDNAFSDIEFKINFTKEKYNLNKTNEKALFIKEVLKIISKLNSVAEQEIYINKVAEIVGVTSDILKRDMKSVKVKIVKKQKKPEQDALEKSFKFIMASYLHHKDYAKFNADFLKYLNNPDFKKLFQLISEKEKNNERFLVANVFDEFDVDNNSDIKDLISFDFEIIENQKEYFNQCLWRIIENDLKFKKSLLSKQYLNETSAESKAEILKNINLIEIKLKNKKLEEI